MFLLKKYEEGKNIAGKTVQNKQLSACESIENGDVLTVANTGEKYKNRRKQLQKQTSVYYYVQILPVTATEEKALCGVSRVDI